VNSWRETLALLWKQFHHKFARAELANLPLHYAKKLVSRSHWFQKAIWEKQSSHEMTSYQPLGTDSSHSLIEVAASLAGRWLFTISMSSWLESRSSKPSFELHAWDLQGHLLRPGELLSKARMELSWESIVKPGISFFEVGASGDLHLVVHVACKEEIPFTYVVNRV
jgi:hypothetical protein